MIEDAVAISQTRADLSDLRDSTVTPKPLIEAVIFDMDGLMLDTEPLYRAAWQRAANELGYTLSDQVFIQMIGRSARDSEEILLNEFGPAFPLAAFQNRYPQLEARFREKPLPKKRGLDELLSLLDSKRVPKAVATSTWGKIAIPGLASAGLLDRFDAIATGDEVTKGKPEPDLFLLAATRLGVEPEECLVLEDAEAGVIAAHRAGMQVFVIPDLQLPSVESSALANGVFDSLAEVANSLQNITFGSRRDQRRKPLKPFVTERLIAAPIRSDDLRELCLMHADPDVMKYMGGVRTEEETRLWLDNDLIHRNVHGFGLCVFRRKEDNKFVGRCGVRRVQVEGIDEVELGYALAAEFWGRGMAAEMARAILQLGFDQIGQENIVALVDEDNRASRRLAEKLGFRFERNTIWKSLPTLLYRLKRSEWVDPR